MRLELAGFGIKVMVVAPGAIKSGIGAANASRKSGLKPGELLNISALLETSNAKRYAVQTLPTRV